MPSITLSDVRWAAPDGTVLFSRLDLSLSREHVGLVGRNGAGKTTLLRLLAGEIAPSSGCISRNAKVGYLPQTLGIPENDNIADLFGVRDQITSLRKMEAGEATASDFAGADWMLEGRMAASLARVGLDDIAPDCQLASLSGGQRTRAALAALFFCDPDILFLDEPTNHLDKQGRTLVIEALRAWPHGLMVASHDRFLLNDMDMITELSGLGLRCYGGNYAAYRHQKDVELAAARHDHVQAEQQVAQSKRRAQKAAERKARTNRQGRILRASGSQSKMLMDVAKQRSENSGGANAHLRQNRCAEANRALEKAREKIEILEPLSIHIASTGLTADRSVLDMEDLNFGFEPDRPVLQSVSLEIRGPERIAIEGNNGTGKSTLLSCIMGDLTPLSGTLFLHVSMALLDQDMQLLNPDQTILQNITRLDPEATQNECQATLARFGFRAKAASRLVGTLSGGQQMRVGLACTLGRKTPPQLLLLDEPSNHLDIETTELLEAALSDYDGALILVSHDPVFIRNIGIDRSLVL